MRNFSEEYIWGLKKAADNFRAAVGTIAILSFTAGMVYGIFWTLIQTDDIVFEMTSQYLAPLVKIYGHNPMVYDSYKYTSFGLFITSFLVLFAGFFIDPIKDALIKSHLSAVKKTLDIKNNLEKAAEEKRLQNSFAKSYSICLSLDYKDKKISPDNKNKLNTFIFEKLNNVIKKNNLNAKVYYKNVMIIYSSDFYNYDKVYTGLLNHIAKSKYLISKKYNLELIPTITTDAYFNDTDIKTIQNNHFEMQGCNFKNRAVATNNFCKKYENINKSKYIGVPIGEYAVYNSSEPKSYELNIIYKDLDYTLKEMVS